MIKTHKKIAILFFLSLVSGWIFAQSPRIERENWITWISRPWEMRYFIHVERKRQWNTVKKWAIESNADSKPRVAWSWPEYFEPTQDVLIPHWRPDAKNFPEDLAVVVMEFDRDGWVTSPNTNPHRLRGRLNELFYVLLSEGEGLADRTFSLGHWFLGVSEDMPWQVTPALCYGADMPDAMRLRHFPETYMYGRDYKLTTTSTKKVFGCREWSYQMQDEERPYIDVTSYVPKAPQYGYPHETYIRPFIGWSRFDRKKPVIGKHADTWYCLHECPGEDKPGPIADIKLWAQAHGWPVPKPPTRMPVFVDDPRKQGVYP
jgi:hypothetical protein